MLHSLLYVHNVLHSVSDFLTQPSKFIPRASMFSSKSVPSVLIHFMSLLQREAEFSVFMKECRQKKSLISIILSMFGIYGFYNEDNTYHQVYILRIYYFSHYQFRDCSNKPFFRKIYNNPLDYCSKRVHNQRIFRNLMRPLGIQPYYQEVGFLHQNNL